MRKAYFAVLTAVSIWGVNFSITKLGLAEIQPITLAFFRFLLSSAILLTIISVSKQWGKLKEGFKKDYDHFAILGLFGITLIFVLENLALNLSTTSDVALIICGDPIFIIILAHVFLKEKLNGRKIISVILGILGVLLIMLKQTNLAALLSSSAFLGNVLALTSSVGWATYTLMTKNLVAKYGPMIVLTIASLFGMTFLFIFMLIFEGVPQIANYSLAAWFIILFVGIVVSTIAFYLWNYGLKHLEASKAGMYMFLMPVIAVIVGIFFLKESLTVQTVIGAVSILVGIYIAERRDKIELQK